MTKKILLSVIAAAMVLAMMFVFTACTSDGGAQTDTTAAAVSVDVKSGTELLSGAWAKFADDQKFFAMGGDMNNIVDNDAGKFDITDTESLNYTLHFPVASVELIDEAASLVHAMNANTFTAAAVHVEDAKDTDALCKAIEDEVKGTQWMCGFPDMLRIYVVGNDYIVYVIGETELTETFASNLTSAFDGACVLKTETSLA